MADDETDAGDDATVDGEEINLDDLDDLLDGIDEFDLEDFTDESEAELTDFSDDLTDWLSDTTDSLSDWTGTDIDIGVGSSSTGWTMMYNFNAIVFIILAVQSLLLAIAVFVPALRTCLCCLHSNSI